MLFEPHHPADSALVKKAAPWGACRCHHRFVFFCVLAAGKLGPKGKKKFRVKNALNPAMVANRRRTQRGFLGNDFEKGGRSVGTRFRANRPAGGRYCHQFASLFSLSTIRRWLTWRANAFAGVA